MEKRTYLEIYILYHITFRRVFVPYFLGYDLECNVDLDTSCKKNMHLDSEIYDANLDKNLDPRSMFDNVIFVYKLCMQKL